MFIFVNVLPTSFLLYRMPFDSFMPWTNQLLYNDIMGGAYEALAPPTHVNSFFGGPGMGVVCLKRPLWDEGTYHGQWGLSDFVYFFTK